MNASELRNVFQRVYVVNLDRRPDRWHEFLDRFPKDWPFGEIERVSAMDGKRLQPPPWWKQGKPAWGCYRSHLGLIERSLNEGVDSILILEDDAVCCDGFAGEAKRFMAHVPRDWGMLYLGGQHLFAKKHPPQHVNQHVYRPYNVNRTHAFALRGDTMRTVYRHLVDTSDWRNGHHIDHHLGRFHASQNERHPVYCPARWLIGQAAGKSDISYKTPDERFWPAAARLGSRNRQVRTMPQAPFVAVLGLHSSGSSALAGVLHHLGVHMGNHLTGYYGNDPDKACGFEARGLAQICDAAIRFPESRVQQSPREVFDAFKTWITDRQREAKRRGTIAGGKHPLMCRLVDHLQPICGDKLKIIEASRPFEESCQSIIRRCPNRDPQLLRDHQQWLQEGKQQAIAKAKSILSVSYADLLSESDSVIQQIIGFLGIVPTDEQISKAKAIVHPQQRHVVLAK